MRTLRCSALGLGTVLMLVILLVALSPSLSESQGGQQPVDVEVVNSPTVRDMDNPARQPVHAYVSLGPSGSTEYTVPAGKRLVIEFVSGSASIQNGDLVSAELRTALGSPATIDHTIPLAAAYQTATSKGYTFAQATRLYADPNTDVSISYSYLGVGTNQTVVAVISGYLVDVP